MGLGYALVRGVLVPLSVSARMLCCASKSAPEFRARYTAMVSPNVTDGRTPSLQYVTVLGKIAGCDKRANMPGGMRADSVGCERFGGRS